MRLGCGAKPQIDAEQVDLRSCPHLRERVQVPLLEYRARTRTVREDFVAYTLDRYTRIWTFCIAVTVRVLVRAY
jgi:hypothetical protein